MKNGVFWDVTRTDTSEELNASFIRVTRICELGTTPSSSETLVLTRAVGRNIPEDTILRGEICIPAIFAESDGILICLGISICPLD
jgi:hypothetical protein